MIANEKTRNNISLYIKVSYNLLLFLYIFEAVKELDKVYPSISIYTSIEKYTIRIS